MVIDFVDLEDCVDIDEGIAVLVRQGFGVEVVKLVVLETFALPASLVTLETGRDVH